MRGSVFLHAVAKLLEPLHCFIFPLGLLQVLENLTSINSAATQLILLFFFFFLKCVCFSTLLSSSVQIQMYQLSRLLHDYHRDLYNHFEEHEICPSLYAAPWFLTLFASQFPLSFVSRIFGIYIHL